MKHLARDLEYLKRQLLTVGGIVEEAFNQALNALLNRDASVAKSLAAVDDVIDAKEVEVEEHCLKVLALHQPVAADLRFIVAVMKVNNDLERIGDMAVNIAERAATLAERPPMPVPPDFVRMAEIVRRMVRESLDALVNQDTALARKVCADDNDVDSIHRTMYDYIQNIMSTDSAVIPSAIQTLSASRHLERIADLATNIAEDVVFMVEGEVIRHRHPDKANGAGPPPTPN